MAYRQADGRAQLDKQPGRGAPLLLSRAAASGAGGILPRETIAVTADILETWQRAGDLEQYQLEQSENDRGHEIGVEFEKKLIESVESGDTDAIKAMLSGPSPDYAAITSLSPEEEKTSEYLVVSVITMITRAAVTGGASLEAAHELGDVYLKRLAGAALNHEPFLGLSYNAMLEFAELVRRAKEEKSSLSYVDACKEYIEKCHYNHSKPHTYAMTAYRNFELERLLNILKTMELKED